ncbi:MAG: DUF3533 domain-containing protein [Candidatus Pristimantibacillus lignocellulolyticus]|uniref:DUF3533 domain-containing protein n=1 Tax=Candidatus Pristimantibacillus lignocellulolyticus TaxID=2994561 RepID=A0A9J6ZHX4_9BACL|nr:MAG: DUF3533 domain-containing protein [Candidatus Pristimantibacillus lignocellulolyticus]
MKISKYKGYAIVIVAVLVVTIIFGVAMFGSIADAKPKELPVALIVLDEGVLMPDGSVYNVGATLAQQWQANAELPFEWQQATSEEELQLQFDNQEVYGAIILPKELSANLLSLATPTPEQAIMKAIYNEGMNSQATSVIKQVMHNVLGVMNEQLSQQLLTQVSAQTGGAIPATIAAELISPIQLEEQIVHPIGERQAMGNAPGLLTQMLWISNLITAAALFFILRKFNATAIHPLKNRVEQATIGLILPIITSALMVWMASSWYGMELTSSFETWVWLTVVSYSFFYMQSALLNWIGLPAMGLLVLLMFFSMPVMNLAPQFLSDVTVTYLYNWTPLRIATSSIREVLYFGGLQFNTNTAITILTIAILSMVLLITSSVAGERNNNEKQISVK